MNWFPVEARSRKRGAPVKRGREKAARRLNSPKLQEAPVEKAEEQEPLRAKVKVVRVLELIQAVKELKSARCV